MSALVYRFSIFSTKTYCNTNITVQG